jgi:hypothetical protein
MVMRTSALSAAMLTCGALLTACNSTTAADYARMDVWGKLNGPSYHFAPSPADLAALGLLKTTEQLRQEGNQFVSPMTTAPASIANVRLIGPKS